MEDLEQTERTRLLDKNKENRSIISHYLPRFFQIISKETWFVAFVIAMLVLATASERVTFKFAVDRMVPYRFLLVNIMLVISFAVFGLVAFVKYTFTNRISPQMSDFPHHKLITMAGLDSLHLSGLVMAASGVTPPMTIVLLHTSTPCMVVGSRLFFPDRVYSLEQLRGVRIISIAVLLSASSCLLNWKNGSLNLQSVGASFSYTLFSAVHGFATLYKENAIITWSQPMDIHYLNSWLFYYQCIWMLFFVPMLYFFQELISRYSSDTFSQVSLSSFFNALSDGWRCFAGEYVGTDLDVSSEDDIVQQQSMCQDGPWLLLGFTLSSLVSLECVDRLIKFDGRVISRAMGAAVFAAFLALGLGRTGEGYIWTIPGTSISIFDIFAIVFLLVGMEIYSRDPEPDAEAITNFSQFEL